MGACLFKSYFEIFWKEVTSRRGAKIEVDISLDKLKIAYEENFTKITQSEASVNLETKMKSIINKYSVWLRNKKCEKYFECK